MTAILRIRNLCAWYGKAQVLHGIDLEVPKGGITALLGANGAGKTSTLRSISNVLTRSEGSVLFDGAELCGLASEKIVQRGVAHVPDGRGTFKTLTVEENLRLGAYTCRTRAQMQEGIDEAFAHFPRLAERHRQQAGTLSGGEQQMLAISRALMLRPRLLLLDEPSFGLAPIIVKEIFAMLGHIATERGISMLLIEQNANMALNIATTAYVIESGRITLAGTRDEVRGNDAVRKAYLGHH